MKNIQLSVALATFNEEDNLVKCLESVSGWVDEIVVADGGSSDRTLEIAKKFKALIFTFDNPTIFHINKQRAIDRCKGKWILQLDADEQVSKELKNEILSTINENNDVNGYWIPRKNFFLGRFLRKGGQYPDYTMRLYKRGKGYLPCKDVHEQAVVRGRVDYLKHALIHYADPTFDRYIFRFSRYTDLISLQFKDRKIKKNIQNALLFFFIKPVWWFLKTYVRHKGFMDGWQGFLFSFFSSLRFPVAFIKYLKMKK